MIRNVEEDTSWIIHWSIPSDKDTRFVLGGTELLEGFCEGHKDSTGSDWKLMFFFFKMHVLLKLVGIKGNLKGTINEL